MTCFSRILLTNNDSSSSKSAAPPPEAVASESDFVIVLAVLLCALICVVGLLATARCAWRRRSGNNHRAVTNRYPSPPNKGLKKKVVQSFPKFTYTTDAAQQVNNNLGGGSGRNSVKLGPLSYECAICLGEFVEGDEIRVLPQCGHGFHVSCIDKWLRSHSSCPSCRQILEVGTCQKSCQFPSVSLPSTSTAARDNNGAELNGRENSVCTANNATAFLP